MEWEDKNILALLATDVDRHFERLVLMYIDQLHDFIHRKTRNQQDTEDILQEAFERALRAMRGYSVQQIQGLKVRPWLYKITLNVYRNHVDRYKRPVSMLFAPLEDDPLLEIEDDSCERPDILVEHIEDRHELEELVATLPKDYREVVSYHFLKDLSYCEIADVLKQPVGTIRVKVHRGLRRAI